MGLMPYGFFTIEQWKRPSRNAAAQWCLVEHLNARAKLSDALERLEQRNKPGFYRVVQMQRMVWAEKTEGKVKFRRWHAGTPEDLARTAATFERTGGRSAAIPRPSK